MLILLSSTRRKRYRDDVLRCLAAPIGTRIQFRYSARIVAHNILERPADYKEKIGLVCSVDLSVVGKSCPCIPVRTVKIENIFVHGSTLSVAMTVEELAFTDEIDRFTAEVHGKSGGQLPVNLDQHTAAQGSTGFFFFEVSSEIGNLRRENTLKNWEQITATLYKQEGYKEEPFFWTILGLRDGAADTVTDTDRFEQWNAHVQANKDYTLLVYIFHPLLDNWTPKTTQLQLTSSLDLSSSYSHDLIVDSPYDLRRWSFKIKPEGIHFGERAWIRIGIRDIAPQATLPISLVTPGTPAVAATRVASTAPEPPQKVANTAAQGDPQVGWEIDLPLKVEYSRSRFIGEIILLGILLALPSVISILILQTTLQQKGIAAAGALVAGLGAALVAKLGTKKPV